jgi:hypothetical protein
MAFHTVTDGVLCCDVMYLGDFRAWYKWSEFFLQGYSVPNYRTMHSLLILTLVSILSAAK